MQHRCRLFEETERTLQTEALHSAEEVSRLSELYSLEKQTTESLERSFERERGLTKQLDQRVLSLQRTVDDLQSKLRVRKEEID